MATKTRTRKSRKSTGPKVDAYQIITDQIVAGLEEGIVPWHRPWRSYSDGPMSLSSRKPYNGINVFILGMTAFRHGYSSRWWGTYKQIAERGGQVRAGEKATAIVFWRFIGEEKDPSGRIIKKGVPMLRTFSVFNADQADDLDVPELDPIPEIEPIVECEKVSASYLSRSGLTLKHGGDRAAYSPSQDFVMMPKAGQFETVEHYYGTLWHEYAHSTGHQSRLNRKGIVEHSASFGDEVYSYEELIAEMSAAFVCGETGIDVNVPHRVGYIASWLSALKGDNKLVVQAAGAAQKAANLILDRVPVPVEDTTTAKVEA